MSHLGFSEGTMSSSEPLDTGGSLGVVDRSLTPVVEDVRLMWSPDPKMI